MCREEVNGGRTNRDQEHQEHAVKVHAKNTDWHWTWGNQYQLLALPLSLDKRTRDGTNGDQEHQGQADQIRARAGATERRSGASQAVNPGFPGGTGRYFLYDGSGS